MPVVTISKPEGPEKRSYVLLNRFYYSIVVGKNWINFKMSDPQNVFSVISSELEPRFHFISLHLIIYLADNIQIV